MRRTPRRSVAVALALVLASTLTTHHAALAQQPAAPTPAQQAEAGQHFERALGLYNEADYKGALVEFKRAYEIAPNVTVLYNLGQTYYQLQDYANALTTFRRFLAEGGTTHRSEVEQSVQVLQKRVGSIDVATPSPGWGIYVDDELVGETPLSKPILVSVGKHRIESRKSGEPTVARVIEVAAGESVAVSFDPEKKEAPPPPGTTTPTPTTPVEESGGGVSAAAVMWIVTGVLAAGTAGTGVGALVSSSSLADKRDVLGPDRDAVESKATQTTALAVTTDVLGVCAIVSAGVAIYLTATGGDDAPAAKTGRIELGAGPLSLHVRGTF